MTPIAYLQKKSGESLAPWILLLPFLFVGILLGVYIVKPGMAIPAAGIAVVFMLTFGWKIETWVIIFLSYMCLTPLVYYGIEYDFFRIYYYPHIAPIVIVLLYTLLKVHQSREKDSLRIKTGMSAFFEDPLSVFITIYMLWSLFGIFWGFANMGVWNYMKSEINSEIYYLSYFFWLPFFSWRGNPRKWLSILSLIALVLSIEYVIFVALSWHTIIDFVIYRMVMRFGQVGVVVFPISTAFALSSKNKWEKALYYTIAFFMVVLVIMLQQRTLWIVLALQAVLVFILYAFRDGNSRKSILTIGSGVGIFVSILLVLFIAVTIIFDIEFSFIFSRWEDVSSGKDYSLIMRVIDGKQALFHFRQNPLLGTGAGSVLFSIASGRLFHYMDNSLATALMKGGIFKGLLLYIIYGIGLWKAFRVFLYSGKENDRILGAGLLGSLVGVLLCSITFVNLLYYRFIFIYMLIMAVVVIYERKTRSGNSMGLVNVKE